MFVSTLTLDELPNSSLLQQLSAGATKLLLAVMAEPNARQSRYIELVGYCERSVRNFGHELLGLGLVVRTATVTDGVAHDLPPKPMIPTVQSSSGRPGETTPVDETSATRQTASVGAVETPPRRGSSRSVRRDRKAAAEVDPLADLDDAQRARYDQLRGQGVDRPGARNLAKTCDDDLIRVALAYVQSRQPESPTRYLVWCLRHPASWYTGVSGAPMAGLNEAISSAVSDEPVPTVPLPLVEVEPALTMDTAEGQAEIDRDPVGIQIVDSEPTLMAALLVTEANLETVLLAYAVEAATGADVQLNVEAQHVVLALQQAGYMAEDVGRFADDVFPKEDWRGQKGESPTLALLVAGIAAVRHRPDSWPLDGLYARVQAIRRHLSVPITLPHLRDLWLAVQEAVTDEEYQRSHCPTCGNPLSMCRCP